MDKYLVNNYIYTITNNRKIKSYIYNYIGANIQNYGIRQEIVNADTAIQADAITLNNPITYNSFEYAPYINTEWYNPIHHINEDFIIQYYVTDRTQEDYFKGIYTKEFLVIIDFNGTIFRRKVKAGNHKINLGKPNILGENYFSIQCIDLSNNYESCIHYKHLKVIDDNYVIQDNQVYTMTEQDLTTYNIVISTRDKVSDEIGASNIIGINSLLKDVRNRGYRKIIFYNPNGDTDARYVYYLQPYNSRDNSIIIPSGLTVDLNKCKWKQLVSYGGSSLLVTFPKDSEDSHLINGYVWGDYDEHIFNKNDPNYPGTTEGVEGEGYGILCLSGAYNSIENLDAGWCTGYSIGAGNNNSVMQSSGITSFVNGYVDINGNDCISDEDIWTCDYQILSDDMKQYRYLQANPYGGYNGLCGKCNDEIVIYYDENKNFIKREKIRQYGLSLIPNDAKYVRFTLCSDTKTGIENITVPGFRIETRNYKASTCWLSKNNYIHDCRTVAFAIGIYNHFTIDNDLIEECGQWLGQNNGQVTALAIDVEDGYQHSEALYIKNLTCSPIDGGIGSSCVNLVTTYDVHMYGVNDCNLAAHKTFGLNLHNTQITKGLFVGRQQHMVTGFMMICDCDIQKEIILRCTSDLSHPDTQINNCIINGEINSYNTMDTSRVTFKSCDITRRPRGNIFVGNEKHIDCIINIEYKHYLTGNSQYINCILVSSNSSSIKLHSNNTVHFRNCDIHVDNSPPSNDGKLIFNYCKLYNSSFNITDDYIEMYECKFINE